MVLKNSSEKTHSYIAADLDEKVFSFSTLSDEMMLSSFFFK
jgi:hypothetical protein